MTQEMSLKDEDSFIRQECEELGVLEAGNSTRKSKSLGIVGLVGGWGVRTYQQEVEWILACVGE